MPRTVLARLDAAAPLERPWVAAVLLAAGGCLALTAVFRRGGRRLVRAGIAVLSAVVLVLGTAAGVNAYVGYVPTLASLANHVDVSSGQLVQLTLTSSRLGVRAGSTFVYLPPGYDSASERNHRYPVVYLLHGFPGYAIDWFRAGMATQTENALLESRLIRPVILVAPTVNNGSLTDHECLDAPRGPKLETYLTSYVVDQIDHRFRTVRSRLGRAIGGFSSGADCALNLGLRHLDRFSVIFAHTVTGEPGVNALHDVLHGDKRLYAANAPFLYLPKMRFTHPVAVYLDSGDANPHVVTREHLLDAELRARGQVVALRIARGQGHTWFEARDGLPYSLSFAARLMYFEPPRATRTLEQAACSLEQARHGGPARSAPTARPEVLH